MPNDLFVHHAVSGGAERSGPFKNLNEAIRNGLCTAKDSWPSCYCEHPR
jgi:hypothetical protein